MNKSTTNRDNADDPLVRIVSKATVGQRVLVNDHFGGVLRYLGTVTDKQGLYCGVELDQKVGKNNGTYGGVVYFECPPGHGIFAPTHKVHPEKCDDISRNLDLIQREQQNKWNTKRMASSVPLPSSSFSSAGAIAPSAVAPLRLSPHPPSPLSASVRLPPPPMDWSLMSIGSTNSDGSAGPIAATSADHFNIFDDALMANSQVTYTVFDSDCMMLSDLELTDSTVLRLEDDEESDREGAEEGEEEEEALLQHHQRMLMLMEPKRSMGNLLDRSVVLDGPTLNLTLPVIDGANKINADQENNEQEEEETPTPMVETRRTDDFREADEDDRLNRNHLRLDLLSKSRGLTKSDHVLQRTSLFLANATNNNTSGVGKTSSPDPAEAADKGLSVGQLQRNNNNPRHSGPQTGEPWGEESHQQKQRKETPKRPHRVPPLFQSAPSTANPMRNKLKPPSKSQMIMEQLKASIEAEKQRAKKKKEEEEQKKRREEEEQKKRREEEEKKKREEGEQKRANKEEEKEKGTTDIEGRGTNGKTSIEGSALIMMEQKNPKKKEAKPRRSVLAPTVQQHRPPLARVSQSSTNASNQHTALPRSNSRLSPSARPVLSSRENTSVALKGTSPASTVIFRSMAVKSQSVEHVAAATQKQQMSGISRYTVNGRAKESKSANSSDRRRREVEEELNKTRQLLTNNAKALDVFAVVAAHFDRKLDDANTKTTAEATQHAKTITELECNWKRRLQRAKEAHRDEIEDIRAKISVEHLENVTQLQQQHQKIVNELEERTQKLEKKLMEQKEKHRRELAESTNQSTNRLLNELESQNYELQVKNDELSKLRQANRELQFQVDKLPEKESQIVKLEARIGDMRDEVNRLRQLEKKLHSQLDGYQHELNDIRVKADALVKEKEVLEYQLNEQNGTEKNCIQQQHALTPRTRKSLTVSLTGDVTPLKSHRTPETQRKHAVSTAGHTLTPRFDMSRSMDSSIMGQSLIACYIQEGRSKPQNTPTKIYTPRDVLEIPPDSTQKCRRVVNFDSTREENGDIKVGVAKPEEFSN